MTMREALIKQVNDYVLTGENLTQVQQVVDTLNTKIQQVTQKNDTYTKINLEVDFNESGFGRITMLGNCKFDEYGKERDFVMYILKDQVTIVGVMTYTAEHNLMRIIKSVLDK